MTSTDEPDSIGRRIAAIRKSKGMTQTALAKKANVSLSMLTKVESGHASPSSVWIGAIALHLDVDTARIVGGIDHAEKVHEVVPQVRLALAMTDVFDDVQPGDLEQLRAEVVDLGNLRRATKYSQVGSRLPSLIPRLLITAETDSRAYPLLADAYHAANSLGHKMGYADLSFLALERMQWAAVKASDPLLSAIVQYLRGGQLARIGAERQALQVMERAAHEIEPMIATNEQAAAVYSSLMMKAGHIASTITQAEHAHDLLDAASEQADRVGDRVNYEVVVGPTNVNLHRMATAIDLGEPAKALEIAERTHLPEAYPEERATYFHFDTARAHLGLGNISGAEQALDAARRRAKEHFRVHGPVKAAIETTALQAYRVTEDIRRLAIAAGMTLPS